jgi:UDP-2,3-diacylglucosamine pyrophosphatase LpxH
MDNLDDKIDTLIRDKLISLIQENVVRIKRTTIKYTKSNKKHTLEHWQLLFDSYGKVFRSMPRDLMRVEKEVRIKFVSPLTNERVTRLKSMMNSEMEVLIQKMTGELRPEFAKLGHGDTFDTKVEETRKKFFENLEQQVQKNLDAVNTETGQGQKLGVDELIKIYNVKESTLHEINIISPLQSINALLAKVNGDPRLTETLENLQQGFRNLFQDIQGNRVDDVATMAARKKIKMDVARDTMTVREIVLNTQPFLEQLALPEDRRNQEVVKKSWSNIFEVLEGQDGRWATALPNFEPLYQFMCGEEN